MLLKKFLTHNETAVDVSNTFQPLNSRNSVRDGFLVFAVLVVISLVNAGLNWEIHHITKSYGSLRIGQILQLDETQLHKIQTIEIAFQRELESLKQTPGKYARVIQLLKERDEQILKVLNGRQQQMMYRHCNDLVTFTKMLSEDSMH